MSRAATRSFRSTRAAAARIVCTAALVMLPAAAMGQSNPPPAAAPGVNAQNAAAAEALFEQARTFMKENRYADACPKLAESYRIDPALGTLLYLADCYEKNGQTASAWATFTDAAALAKGRGEKERAEKASARTQALVPKLSKLTITIASENETLPGLEVKRDGIVVGRAIFGAPVPVDPGEHTIEASAPGKKSWKGTVSVAAQPGAVVAFAVPPLENEPVASPSGPTAPLGPAGPQPGDATGPIAPEPGTRASAWRTTGLVVGSLGIAGLAVGGALGLIAKSKNDDALKPENCPTPTQCYDTGIELTQQAQTFALGSTVAFAAGGALAATGTILFVYGTLKGKSQSASPNPPTVSLLPGGIMVRGEF